MNSKQKLCKAWRFRWHGTKDVPRHKRNVRKSGTNNREFILGKKISWNLNYSKPKRRSIYNSSWSAEGTVYTGSDSLNIHEIVYYKNKL